MQKSGIKFWELMPRTIVPLDSAFVNLVYAVYSTAFSGFLQVIKLGVKEYIKQKTTPPCGHPSTGGERSDVFKNSSARSVQNAMDTGLRRYDGG